MDASLQEIVARVEVSSKLLDRECSKENVIKFAEFCEPWKLIGRHLKLEDSELAAIDSDYRTTEEKRVQALSRWKNKSAHKATYRVLIEVFMSCKQAKKAEKILKVIKHQSK